MGSFLTWFNRPFVTISLILAPLLVMKLHCSWRCCRITCMFRGQIKTLLSVCLGALEVSSPKTLPIRWLPPCCRPACLAMSWLCISYVLYLLVIVVLSIKCLVLCVVLCHLKLVWMEAPEMMREFESGIVPCVLCISMEDQEEWLSVLFVWW